MSNGTQSGLQYEVTAPDGTVGTVSAADKGKVSGGYKLTGRIQMFSPDGVRGFVDSKDLQTATKAGYQTTPKTELEKKVTGKGISLEGSGGAALGGYKDVGAGLGSGVLDLLDPTSPGKRSIETGKQIFEEVKAGWKRGKEREAHPLTMDVVPGAVDPSNRLSEAVLSGLGPLVGFSASKQAEHAERGEGGKILGEAAVPLSLMAAGEVLPKVAKPVGKYLKESPVGKFVKDVAKSKVTELEEAHAAQAAEAEKMYQKQLAEHKEKVQAVKDKYAKQIQEHSVEAKTTSAKESAAQAKTGAALEHQNELAGLLKENLELADKKIASELGKEFDKVTDAVEAKKPKVSVADAEREARGKLYFPDSVSAFNKIMENVSGKLKMTDYSILRKAYSNLNDVLYGGGEMPADLHAAVKTVRDSLGKDLQAAADKAGLGGKYSKAMKDWHAYKDTFSDKSAIAKGGSPIRRILDAEDPQFVIDQLKGKAGQRLLEDIAKYQKYGADSTLAGRLKGFIEKVKGMPSSTGEIPEAPTRPELPKAPERLQLEGFDREAVARKILIDRIKKALMYGGAAAGGGYLYEKFGGGHPPVP
jgi:hypothetical protein